MRSILVLRGGALGDFIVTLPALAVLRQRWPAAKIELVGNVGAARLAQTSGLLDRVHSQHESQWSALYATTPLPTPLRERLADFDLIISFWPDPAGALGRHFPVRAGQRFVTGPAMPVRTPAAAHYCEALRPLGILTSSFWYPLRKTVAERSSDAAIAIHPGSGSATKNWPRERWFEVIRQLPARLWLILGEAEMATWNEDVLATALGGRGRDGSVRVLTNSPLETLADELSSCAFFLGHDSGVSHLAAACGTPCVLLFGPTDPAMWAPPAPHVRVVRAPNGRLADLPVGSVLDAING